MTIAAPENLPVDLKAWNQALRVLKQAREQIAKEQKQEYDKHFWAGELVESAYWYLKGPHFSTGQFMMAVLNYEKELNKPKQEREDHGTETAEE